MDECMTYEISTDEIRSYLPELHAGDRVLLSGRIYTSRDAAHKRICEALDNGSPLPYNLRDAIIYYAGPTPAPVWPSAPAVPQPPGVWTAMRPVCWIWVWPP